MSGVAVGPRQPDRKIDGGVVGHFEKQNLRCADKQRGLDARRLRRRTALEKNSDQMAQGAKPPQHGRDQRAGQARGRAREGRRAQALAPAPSNCSSSGRCRRSTASTMSAATRRAARPGYVVATGGSGTGCRRAPFIPNCSSAGATLSTLARLRQVTGDANRPNTAKARRRPTEGRSTGEEAAAAGGRARARRSRRPPRRTRSPAGRSPKEIAGRDGPEPTRYGDWEINGLTSDFG